MTTSLLYSAKISLLNSILIQIRRRFTQKLKLNVNTSSDDLDLLGDDEDFFTGSEADLEGAAVIFSHLPAPIHYS